MNDQSRISKEVFECLANDAIKNKKALKLEDKCIDFRRFDVGDLVGLSFLRCEFSSGLTIVNAKKINYIVLDACVVCNDISIGERNVELRDIDAGQLIIQDLVAKDYVKQGPRVTNSVSVLFKGVSAEGCHVRSSCIATLDFDCCTFEKKIYVQPSQADTSPGLKDLFSIEFYKCLFFMADIRVTGFRVDNLALSDCQGCENGEGRSPASCLRVETAGIRNVRVCDSSLPNMNIYFDQQIIDGIDISGSKVKSFNLYHSKEELPPQVGQLAIEHSSLGDINFRKAEFIRPFDIRSTKFTGYPNFLNCTIPQGCQFPGPGNFLGRNANLMAACYRSLRLAMEEQRARKDEGIFFRLEQECYISDIPVYKKLISLNFWYGLFSSHGTSYAKPMMLLVVVSLVFTAIYAILLSPAVSVSLPVDWNLLVKSLVFSLKHVMLPFWSMRNFDPSQDEMSEIGIIVIGMVQSLVSSVLVLLSILAVRWRFKRG